MQLLCYYLWWYLLRKTTKKSDSYSIRLFTYLQIHMKKILWICFTIGVSLILAWCKTVTEQDRFNICKSYGTWYIYAGACYELRDYCMSMCSRSINNALSDINDTRGNKWGFPDAVTEQFNLCVERCVTR